MVSGLGGLGGLGGVGDAAGTDATIEIPSRSIIIIIIYCFLVV